MSDPERVRRLVGELLDTDRSPEDVCAAEPRLLDAVRARLQRVRMLDAEIDAWFPTQRGEDATQVSAATIEPPRVDGYAVEAEIGRGGMGVVYKARHLRLGRDVALKMLLAGELAAPAQLARFAREAEVVASLRHPHIVPVYDVGDHARRPYFTMELMEGGSLAQVLRGAPLPAREAAALVATLADAVEAAHARGVIHRDLKPANVLLDSSGAPKISDFGLALRVGGDDELTASGMTLGTPSYMAPEQALGHDHAIGPTTDVYALGAILYETLTGRPPFRAATRAETQRQVIDEEPVRPSRLDARAPRDLETICMKCLRKDPVRRFASAAALAEDLRRYLRDEPITARPIGVFERGLKWARRRPGLSIAIAGIAVSCMAVVGGALWLGLERASTERATQDDLRMAADAQRLALWVDARTALERAKARLGERVSGELGDRVAAIESELAWVARLDAIRLRRAASFEGRIDVRANRRRADREYQAAFAAFGLDVEGDDPAAIATRIAESDIAATVVAALDDWSICAADGTDDQRLASLLEVARRADVGADSWSARVRDFATWRDLATSTALAGEILARPSPLPATVLRAATALGERLHTAGGDPRPLLLRLQREHPGDFWINLALGDALRDDHPDDAIRYYQAALALRPDAAVVRNNLGHALALADRIDEAIEQLEHALRLDPSFAQAMFNVGNTYARAGRDEEAIEAFERARAMEPDAAPTYANLARALANRNRLDEALAAADRALELDPEYVAGFVHRGYVLKRLGRVDEAIAADREALARDEDRGDARVNLGFALLAKGMVHEAVAEFERAIAAQSDFALAHTGLGSALRHLGRIDEAVEHSRTAVRIQPDDATAQNDLGVALATQGDLGAAIEHLRRATELEPKANVFANLGNVYGLIGRFDESVDAYRSALRLDPSSAQANAALGQALIHLGRLTEARAALELGRSLFREGARERPLCDEQIAVCDHFLAYEARLPAVLAGHETPTTPHETVEFARLCRLRGHGVIAATLFARAFDAEPELGSMRKGAGRDDAARVAARVGAGRGADASELDESTRSQWRARARTWLREDLTESEQLVALEPALGGRVADRLALWLHDVDLASLRDEAELARLPDSERRECRLLWLDVEDAITRLRAADGAR